MKHTHPRPWRRESVFGEGPRRKLDRELRAQWKARVELWRRSRNRDLHLTGDHTYVAFAMLRHLGTDGRCDPSHQTIATFSGKSVGCVKEALRRLKRCGLLLWVNRLWRPDGRKVKQNSNAYILTLGEPPVIQTGCCESTRRREPNNQDIKITVPVKNPHYQVSYEEQQAAREALAKVKTQLREREIARYVARQNALGRGLVPVS